MTTVTPTRARIVLLLASINANVGTKLDAWPADERKLKLAAMEMLSTAYADLAGGMDPRVALRATATMAVLLAAVLDELDEVAELKRMFEGRA